MLVIIRRLLLFSIFFSFSLPGQAENTLEWVGCGISKKSYMNRLAEAYKRIAGVNINLQGGGATRGIRDVAAGKADLGGSCRYHLPDNQNEQSIGYEPVAWDALAVIVNKNNPVQNINFDQVRDLYEGKINNWKQLGGKDAPIKLYIRKGKISGVGYTIRKLIYADINKEFVASKVFKSSGPLEKAIVEDPDAIGITGISSARLRDVKILSLNDKFPDFDTIKKGQYALYRPLFITFNPTGPNMAEVKKFIKFAHSKTGRNIMKDNGVVPYLEALRLVMKQAKQEQHAQASSAQLLTY